MDRYGELLREWLNEWLSNLKINDKLKIAIEVFFSLVVVAK